MVMRVFPVVGITAPRLPLEKSYTFFIVSLLLGVRLSHRYGSRSVTPRSVNHDHQRPEYVRSNSDEALFVLGRVIFDGEREGIIQHAVTLRERHAVLVDVCCILPWVKIGGHTDRVCTLCISVNCQAGCQI